MSKPQPSEQEAKRSLDLVVGTVLNVDWWKAHQRHTEKAYLKAAEARRAAEAKLAAVMREHYEIEQVLGKALHYPEADETIMEKPDGSVVVGEHTSVTIAMETARTLARVEKRTQWLEDFIRENVGVDSDGAPKHRCGYTYAPDTGYCEVHDKWFTDELAAALKGEGE